MTTNESDATTPDGDGSDANEAEFAEVDNRRSLTGPALVAVSVVGIAFSAFQLWLAARGFDPTYGARPLKRLIPKEVVNELARLLLKRDDDRDATFDVEVSQDGAQLRFAEVFDDVAAWVD